MGVYSRSSSSSISLFWRLLLFVVVSAVIKPVAVVAKVQ